MRLSGDPAAATMSSSGGSGNFLLVPIPEYPPLDCVPNKTVKIVVLGASNVGKTALIVRFLTKRFIGDYEANTGALYSRKVALDGEEVSLQIQDTPCVALQVNPPDGGGRPAHASIPEASGSVMSRTSDDAEGLHCQEQINRSIYWADGYVLVYSITDLHSYRTIQPLYQHVRRIHPSGNIPVILVGNKSDLLRARQVPADEGETLAATLGGVYFEASARENHEGVHATFLHLCQEVVRALGGGNGEKRRGGLHLARPKSPNMQELKRRFRQVLSSKVKSSTAL
ncbi:ras-like protein family member 11A-like isoform X1 [Gasterosteus aculeatus]|uniref:small monomeric GTPase n=1 Tax=Gasterosteus aculeatus aculeatus TaxID=481459 RepID=G3Q4D4_GASAC|nr:ras-like protein family member 11A-like isoform X1 [Gasterosteus aculeatus aculeatus]